MDAAVFLPVRATVHLQGLACGATANVDPEDPYIAGLLGAHLLVPLADRRLPSVSESPDGDAAPQQQHADVDVGG